MTRNAVPDPPSPPTWKARLWKAAKHGIMIAVLIGVSYSFYHSLSQLNASQLQWQPEWLIVAGLAYLLSMTVSMCYWWWSMVALGQKPRGLDVARAYFIGHLGKYVPGKALVIIMRAVLVQSETCRPSIAAITVVYETLSLMAAGAVWLVAVLCWTGIWDELPLWATAAIVGTVCLPIVPPIFNLMLKKILKTFRQVDVTSLPQMNYRFLGLGILFGLFAWVFMGLSLAAAIRSVNDSMSVWSGLILITAQFAAATIVGWIIPTPGGLGGREAALKVLLQSALGDGLAALVALLLRLTWIVTELIVSALLYPLPWFRRSELPK
jgi:glycosyltransferase 2 family protein